jgi:hypothetical protein
MATGERSSKLREDEKGKRKADRDNYPAWRERKDKW